MSDDDKNNEGGKVASIGKRASGAWDRVVDQSAEAKEKRLRDKPLEAQEKEALASYVEWRRRVFQEKQDAGLILPEDLEGEKARLDFKLRNMAHYDRFDWTGFVDEGGVDPLGDAELLEATTYTKKLRENFRQKLKENQGNPDFDAETERRQLDGWIFDILNCSRHDWSMERGRVEKFLSSVSSVSTEETERVTVRYVEVLCRESPSEGVKYLLEHKGQLGSHFEAIITSLQEDRVINEFQAAQLRRGTLPVFKEEDTEVRHMDPADSL